MFFKLKFYETSGEKFYISPSTKLDIKKRAYADFITTIFENASIKSKCGSAAESITFTLGFPKSMKDKIKRKCELSTAPEAYAVTVNKAIKIYAASELGFIYAMQTLLSLQESGELRRGFIYDYPLMQTRGYRVFLPSRAGFDDFKRMVDLLSYYKYNSIMLEIGGAMEYKRHPEINIRWAEFCKEVHTYSGRTTEIQRKTYPWKKNSIHADNAEGDILTQDECRELAEYCRSRGLEVIPECPTLSHCDYLVMAHPEIREREGDEYPDSYCPNHKGTYPLVFDILNEVIEVFKPKTINIGHDEMYSIGVCPRCRRTTAPVLYANDIKVLKEFLDSHGVKTMMWGEKLLNAHKGREAIGGAGHGKGYARVPALYHCRDLIPNDVEILHWYYVFNHEYDKVYHERGFKTVYGNLDAMNVEHWNMRREWGIRGGYVSNWGSFGEEYMQRNHQYFALISTAYAFWCDDFEEMGHEARLAMTFEECYRLKLAKIKNPIKITHTTQHNIKFKWFYDGEFIVDDEYLLGNYEILYTDGKVATLPVKYGTNIGKYSYDDYLHESAFRELSYATMPIRYKGGFAYECVYEDPNLDGKIVGISYIAAAGKEDIGVEMISFAKPTNVIRGATDTGITLSATAEFAWDGDIVKQGEKKMIPEQTLKLPECNFPTKWQAVLFRNIGMIPMERIAKVLRTDEKTLMDEAKRLGIDNIEYNPVWEKSGHITIIRSNWYLLPTEQILELMEYTEEHLAFVIREEDFLFGKLSHHKKPSCDAVYYAPLTEAELAQTARIKALMDEMDYEQKARPFDFFSNVKSAAAPPDDNGNTRFIHGYLTPCGDAFLKDSREYLSDELLAEYKKQGVNGLWMHGFISTLSPYPFMPERSADYKERRKNLNELIERAAKYGIKIYVYFNEPRCLPHDVAPKYSRILGHTHLRGRALCMAYPEVVQYLYDSFHDFVKECSGLGGIMTITMSENPTHCRSKDLDTNCPRCKNTPFEELCALVNNTVMRAIKDSGAKTELIANLWSWSNTRGWSREQILRGIDLLDKDISVLMNSEFDLPFEKGGVHLQVVDYSISNPGPSPMSAEALKHAADAGHKVYAKIQASNSWECSAVPYLPVYDLVKEHINNLSDIGVDNYMLSWTLGGYPSPTLNYIANYKNMSLDEWYGSYYGDLKDIVSRAVKLISDGFREFPFSVDHIYFSPQTLGPYNMWSVKPEEKESTMVCFAFDDYEKWTKGYPYEVFISQTEMMLAKWSEGIDLLKTIEGRSTDTDALIRYAEAAYLHLRADLLHTKYSYMKRDIKKYKSELIELAKESSKDAKRLSQLQSVDATIGFEASNHYYYTPHLLKEKVINIDKFIKELEAIK